MAGDFTQAGHPHVVERTHVFDEPFEGFRPRRPPGQERMIGQHPAAALLADRVELRAPHLDHPARSLDGPGPEEVRHQAVLVKIVHGPLDRDLHQRITVRDRQLVGVVGVHQAAVVQKASVAQQLR